MFSPPKIRYTVYICLHLFTVFCLIQPSSKQIICFDFGKQNSVLLIVSYVPCLCYDWLRVAIWPFKRPFFKLFARSKIVLPFLRWRWSLLKKLCNTSKILLTIKFILSMYLDPPFCEKTYVTICIRYKNFLILAVLT